MLVVTKLLNIAINNFDAKKLKLVVTELVVSGTQCSTIDHNVALVYTYSLIV